MLDNAVHNKKKIGLGMDRLLRISRWFFMMLIIGLLNKYHGKGIRWHLFLLNGIAG